MKLSPKELTRALEYLAFVDEDLWLVDSNKEPLVKISDFDPDGKKVKLKFVLDKKLKENADFPLVSLGGSYKNQYLLFEISLDKIENGDEGEFQCEGYITENCELYDNRGVPRFKIEDRLASKVIVETIWGKLVLNGITLLNYSIECLAFLVKREDGLALPGDSVKSIHISNDEELVLSFGEAKVKLVKVLDDKYYKLVVDISNNILDSFWNKQERRKSSRVDILDGSNFYIEYAHPFFKERRYKQDIINLSNSGICVALANDYPFINGNIIHPRVHLGKYGTLDTMMKINNSTTKDGQIRSGMEYIKLSGGELKTVTNAITNLLSKNIIDATAADYDRLWSFFFETGFIYRSKRKQLQKIAPKILNTYKRLMYKDNEILKKVIYKDDGEIKGHVSAIKFFDKSWIIQHLNAVKIEGPTAAKKVMEGMCTFFADDKANRKSHTHFANMYYRPDNLYPAIFFGGIEKFVNDPEKCRTKIYEFCLMREDVGPYSLDEGERYSYRLATDKDLEVLERKLIEDRDFLLMKVEDLIAEKFTNLECTEKFKQLGLYRFRKVLVVEDTKEKELAFAVCNFSSPGINLSELTNSFRLFFTSNNTDLNFKMANIVCHHVIAEYSQTEMPCPVLLLDQNDSVPVQFEIKKKYVHWIMSADNPHEFKAASDHIFKNLKKRIKEFAQNHAA